MATPGMVGAMFPVTDMDMLVTDAGMYERIVRETDSSMVGSLELGIIGVSELVAGVELVWTFVRVSSGEGLRLAGRQSGG